jgi:hypothetical protein
VAERTFPFVYGGLSFPDVPEHAAVLELSAFGALGAAGAETTLVPHDASPASGRDLWTPWNPSFTTFDRFGRDVPWAGRILSMSAGLWTPAAVAPDAAGLWASWWIERYRMEEGGGELALEAGAYPVLADGQDDLAASPGHHRPFLYMGTGGAMPAPLPIRSWSARDPLLLIDSRTLLRAKVRHDLGDIVPALAATCRVQVRATLALWALEPEALA